MEKNSEFGNFPPYVDDPMFNPVNQYEQAFMYYRYLTCQMEYKIRCKEYEKLCKSENKRVIE